MASLANVVLVIAVISTAKALTITTEPYLVDKDHVIENTHHNSKPGTPKFKDWNDAPLFSGGNDMDWRGELGMQVLEKVKAQDAMNYCKRFVSVGDYTWCKQAMPKESSYGVQSTYPEHEYVLPEVRRERFSSVEPNSLVALSIGASLPDIWSEMMSNKFRLKTQIFDCNFQPVRNGKVQSFGCTSPNCYNMEYDVENICIDDARGGLQQFTMNSKTYQPMALPLQGRERLSTFVKLDIDGAEWKTLEWLVKNDDEINKIRTLDVNFYMTKDLDPDGSSEESMTHHVEIIGKLSQKFAVVGSTIEGDLLLKKQSLLDDDSDYEEPLIHTQGGLPLEEFTISYMNRLLL